MDSVFLIILVSLIAFFSGIGIGWGNGRSSAVRECERLGAFYLGDKVFECKLKGK